MMELQKYFGEIHLKQIATDVFFIMDNIRIDCQMDSGEFEGLLYTILSEYPFKYHRFDMTY